MPIVRDRVPTRRQFSGEAAPAHLDLGLLGRIVLEMAESVDDRQDLEGEGLAHRVGAQPPEDLVAMTGLGHDDSLDALFLRLVDDAFGCRTQSGGITGDVTVIAAEQYPDQAFLYEHGIELVPLDELYARSDVVSLHCPFTEETAGMINKESIAKMKPGAIFLNLARGGLVASEEEAKRNPRARSARLRVVQLTEPTS